ncbi:hypothetical protein QBC47DRAFT_225283 [Echria macrotheca]|uniref:DUF4440 domain-containing protein n=1 Tax=Echria macrotheca TaxID=438768 RepID=A0AAJ0F8V6_9PEZI|nr:hypothetical protein QBC47DRAFT_225283 [Echria macrotheca]
MPAALGLTTDTKTKTASSPAPPGSSSNKMGGGQRLDTISKRNHAAAREIETLLWRALCDSPEAAKEYMAEDCIMINPLFGGSSEPMSKHTDPSIEKILEGAEPWTGFRFHGDPLVVEIDLMAVALVYKVTLFKASRKGGIREVTATCSSSWRQTAGADWLLCAQHVAYADDD